MHAQAGVHHPSVVPAHLAGPDRVKDGGADCTGSGFKIGLLLHLRTRPVFPWGERRHGWLRHDPARTGDAVGRDLAVFFGTEVVAQDFGRIGSIWAANTHVAPAAWP